ncbi:MAG: cell wall-binding repeat-containing protein [Rhodoglobus sp.]
MARFGGAIIATLALIGALFSFAPQSASALDGSGFDPGYIISDTQFYDSHALSESEIQAFLYAKGPASCNTAAHPGYKCLYELKFSTFTKTANPMCSQYTGAVDETVARIIAKVSVACGISPKVLLVMLQKEQGLITDTWPTTGQLNAAMGAGCPDTAGCDPAQAGFYQQVYGAAYLLIRYGMPPGTGPGTPYTSNYGLRYPLGQPSQVLYQANNPGCGSRTVVVRNQPTASLYWYTPYTPNAAALANLFGPGDACSAYGNRNFWAYFSNWFGNPTLSAPPAIIPSVTTSRIQGVDRYETAVKVSQSRGNTANVVYIASGENYPDALSAAPAATVLNGPLLLVGRDQLPSVVSAELTRLHPSKIVVVGSEDAVGADVFAQLSTFAPTVTRIGGADRFETSRLIAESAFPAGSTGIAYIATGGGFADALAAGAAAGARNAPVLLVNGGQAELDAATIATLQRLGVTKAIIAGSSAAVSDGIQASLGTIPGLTVTRLGGEDRFVTASLISKDAFPTSTTVYLATAYNFPDALAGAALAGSRKSALLLVSPACILRQTAQDIIDLKATSAVFLGSVESIGASVETWKNCN